MITNSQIQRLLDTDRVGLVELMVAAYRQGAQRGVDSSLWFDNDFRSLIDEVRREARDMYDVAGASNRVARWNAEMQAVGGGGEEHGVSERRA